MKVKLGHESWQEAAMLACRDSQSQWLYTAFFQEWASLDIFLRIASAVHVAANVLRFDRQDLETQEDCHIATQSEHNLAHRANTTCHAATQGEHN